MTVTVQVGDYEALVRESRLELVSRYLWRPQRDRNGLIYAIANVNKPDGKRTGVLMHRLIMDAPKGVLVDHRNHDGLDNRCENLRLATTQENGANMRLRPSNTSGRKGVSWYRRTKIWRARIKVSGTQIHLGFFDDLDEAALAYDEAAMKYFGKYACTNAMLGLLGKT